MKWPPEWLPRDADGKVARWQLAGVGKKVLRAFLATTPIRANHIKKEPQRERFIKEETELRIQTLFALYDIPEDWDELLQWRQLAFCLAAETFAGCRTFRQGRTGRNKSTADAKNKEKLALLAEYRALGEELRRTRPTLSEKAISSVYVMRNRERCAAVGLKTAKSFSQAMRRLRENTGRQTPA